MRRSQKALDKRGTLQQLPPQISFQRNVETSVYVGRRDAHGQCRRDATAVPTKQPELTSEVSADAAETSKSTPDFLSRLGRSSPAGAAFASFFYRSQALFSKRPGFHLAPTHQMFYYTEASGKSSVENARKRAATFKTHMAGDGGNLLSVVRYVSIETIQNINTTVKNS